jgi:hypothetical protein
MFGYYGSFPTLNIGYYEKKKFFFFLFIIIRVILKIKICDDIPVTRLTIGYVFVAFFAGMGQQW